MASDEPTLAFLDASDEFSSQGFQKEPSDEPMVQSGSSDTLGFGNSTD
jgi:hypothetical protein